MFGPRIVLLITFSALSGCVVPTVSVSSKGISGTAEESTITPSPTPSATAVSATYAFANTASAFSITSRLNQAGTVYYAVFSSDPGALTAAQVKAYALSTPSGSLAAVGSLAVAAADVDVAQSISGLPDKTLYTVFAVAEGPNGLAADGAVKKLEKVIPKRVSLQNYASAVTGGVGATIRYNVYYPPGYYDDPTASYPLLIYLGGGGEIPNSAGNAETIFTTGQYRIEKTPYIANIALGQTYPFIIVVPQCNQALFNCASYTQTAWTHEVVTKVESTYRVNSKRIYMVGVSYGGGGVWNYLIAHPEKIAAAVPVAAATINYTTGAGGTLCAAAANHLAVWAPTNVNDGVISPSNSSTAVGLWNGCAGVVHPATYTGLPGNIFPATENTHFTIEYVVNAPWVRYSPSPAALDPTGVGRVPLEPGIVSQLATFSTAMGVTLNTVEDWLLRFSKP